MPARKILVINPNTSTFITKSFQPVLSDFESPDVAITYWTSPVGPAMIKSERDLHESAAQCLPLLLTIADEFDGFLAACFADHPLVTLLRLYITEKPVVSIFEASIFAALRLLDDTSTFGIVTTAMAYEKLLDQGVKTLLGSSEHLQFSGTCASGVGLVDLDPELREQTREKVIEATRRLIRLSKGTLGVVNMGGVILSGMEEWVHQACELELGVTSGKSIKVVDQLVAGMLMLEAALEHTSPDVVDFKLALR